MRFLLLAFFCMQLIAGEYEQGMEKVKTKNYKEALDFFIEATNLGLVSDDMSRFYLATSYSKVGMYVDSLRELDYLEKQLLDDTISMGVYTQKGNILVQQQKNDEALKYFEKALFFQKNKNFYSFKTSIYSGIGMAEKQKRNYERALKFFSKALDSANKISKLYIANNIGITYLNQKILKNRMFLKKMC